MSRLLSLEGAWLVAIIVAILYSCEQHDRQSPSTSTPVNASAPASKSVNAPVSEAVCTRPDWDKRLEAVLKSKGASPSTKSTIKAEEPLERPSSRQGGGP